MAEARYILWGSAGHAKVLDATIRELGGRVVAVFDRDPDAERALPEAEFFVGDAGFEAWHERRDDVSTYRGLVAIGGARGRDRVEIGAKFFAAGIAMPSLVHPKAHVCSTARLGAGTQVLANATVASDSSIGAACIINHNASIDHECRLGEGVHVAPGATLCGCIVVECFAFIGAGAVVLPRLKIGNGSIVGAGAVVTRDVPPGVVVVGNPATILRQSEE